MNWQHVWMAVLVGTGFTLVLADNDDKRKEKKVIWKSLLYHHREWRGFYSHGQTRFMCSMTVHSIETDNGGPEKAMISFSSEGFHIDMRGTSPDGQSVIFREHHVWEKSVDFSTHTDLVFTGMFLPDVGYYSYKAKVTSRKTNVEIGSITLIPHGTAANRSDDRSNQKGKKPHMGLAIGVPILMGVIVLIFVGFLLTWAVHKGYLRHVPWSYKSFQTPKQWRAEMEKESKVTITKDGKQEVCVIESEQASMHI